MAQIEVISSRANAWLKDLRRLAQDGAAYRKQGLIWVEGEHLLAAAVASGQRLHTLVLAQSQQDSALARWQPQAERTVVVADALWREFTALESPCLMGALIRWERSSAWRSDSPTVVLDRLQDAGNVGSILRSAAAFGFVQVLALQGCAALWSGKVLRAGMGAHFGLQLFEGVQAEELQTLALPLLATSSHAGQALHEQPPPWPCAWVFGHEGQGVAPALLARATQTVRIIQPGGQESLNVAAPAAVCL
ncbi:MAG: RNA methyltransferase, partial [Betaproteobacteria bacterium]